MTDLVRLFKAMGDETRLRIVLALTEETYGVCDLAKCLGIPQPTLSHHLKSLRDAGLVIGEREGQWTYCRLNEARFKEIGLNLTCLFKSFKPDVFPREVSS